MPYGMPTEWCSNCNAAKGSVMHVQKGCDDLENAHITVGVLADGLRKLRRALEMFVTTYEQQATGPTCEHSLHDCYVAARDALASPGQSNTDE